MEALREDRQLIAPVRAVSTNAVQKHHQRTLAHVIDRDAWRRADMLCLAAVHDASRSVF